jgi:N-acetylmuramic acid 6-phosphate etherase
MTVTGACYDDAGKAIADAGGKVKTAIVMLQRGCGRDEAERLLEGANGFVRGAIEAARPGGSSS